MTLTPTEIATRLRDAGHHEAALQVALDALTEGTPAAGAPTGWSADPPERGYLTLDQLKKLTVPEAEALRRDHPDVYAETLRNLDGTVPHQQLLDMSREDIEAFKRRDPQGYANSVAALARGAGL